MSRRQQNEPTEGREKRAREAAEVPQGEEKGKGGGEK